MANPVTFSRPVDLYPYQQISHPKTNDLSISLSQIGKVISLVALILAPNSFSFGRSYSKMPLVTLGLPALFSIPPVIAEPNLALSQMPLIPQSDDIPVTDDAGANAPRAGGNFFPEMAALQGGNFVNVWLVRDPQTRDSTIRFQRFSQTGEPIGAISQVGYFGGKDHRRQSVAALDKGWFTIAWLDYASSSGSPVFQVFDEQGKPKTLATRAIPRGEGLFLASQIQASSSENGDFRIFCMGNDALNRSSETALWMRSFNRTGTPKGDAVEVASGVDSFSVVSVPNGRAYALFEAFTFFSFANTKQTLGILGQKIDGEDRLIGPPTRVDNQTTERGFRDGVQYYYRVNSPRSGDIPESDQIIAIWNRDVRSDERPRDFKRRLTFDGGFIDEGKQFASTRFEAQVFTIPTQGGGALFVGKSENGIVGQQYDSDDQPVGNATRMTSNQSKWSPSAGVRLEGGEIVLSGTGGSIISDVFLRLFSYHPPKTLQTTSTTSSTAPTDTFTGKFGAPTPPNLPFIPGQEMRSTIAPEGEPLSEESVSAPSDISPSVIADGSLTSSPWALLNTMLIAQVWARFNALVR